MTTATFSRRPRRAILLAGALLLALLGGAVPPAHAAALKFVQSGTTAIGASSASATATLSAAIDPTKAFLVFGVALDSNNPFDAQVSGQITNPTTLTFARDAGATAVTVEWYVAEFQSGVSVQRGTAQMPDVPVPATLDVPINPVALSRSFPLVSWRTNGATYDSGDSLRASIIENGTNGTCNPAASHCLRLYAQDADTRAYVEWQVVEYQDATVASGALTLPSTGATSLSNTAPATITAGKSWLVYSYSLAAGGANIGQKLVRGWFNGATLTFDRDNNGATALIDWYVVTFTDETTVQHGVADFTAATQTVANVGIAAANPTSSVALAGYHMRGGRSPYNDAVNDNPGVGWFTCDLSSPAQLVVSRGASGLATASVGWFVLSFVNPQCPPLGVTEDTAAGTLTVTAPASFELRFNTVTGGAIDQFYDLAEDPTRTRDLVGSVPGNVPGLHNAGISQTGTPTNFYNTSRNDTGAKLDLLEATPTRVRVRQEAFYQSTPAPNDILAGVKGVGDYSVYPSGRTALRWSRSATSAVSFLTEYHETVLHHTSSAPLNAWTAYREAGATTGTPGTDAFVMAQSDVAGARTDFLNVMSATWPSAYAVSWTYQPATVERLNMYWYRQAGSLVAGDRESWNFLTYFKPTDLESGNPGSPWLSPLVTSRSADYRSPSAIARDWGEQWLDGTQNTGAGDDYNEAEGAYVLGMAPGQGLQFRMDGTVANPRYSPFFKIRKWRSFVNNPRVTLNGSPLTREVDYKSDAKPFSRAHWASGLAWHCTMESTTACNSGNLDVGLGTAGSTSGTTAVAGRYGNGLLFTANTDRVIASSADFDPTIGALEFWYQPRYASNDNVRYLLWYWQTFTNPTYNCITFEKTGGNLLQLSVIVGATNNLCTIGGTTYSASVSVASGAFAWRAYDWVHLKTSWNSAGGVRKLRIVVNGVEAAVSGTFTAPGGSSTPAFGGCNLNCPGGAGANPNGILDEVHLYGGLELGGYDTNSPFAHGGLKSDAAEYLADTAKNWTLQLTPVGASVRRGSYLHFGSDSPFLGLNVALQTPGVWSTTPGDLVWEYWNGTGWASLESGFNFTDTTNQLTRNGTLYWDDPSGWAPYSVNGGPDLYHVRVHLAAGTLTYSTRPMERLITTDILLFQYCGNITAAAQEFSFSLPPTTAVELLSFEAFPSDAAVDVSWRTGSELDNLGFHLHRSSSDSGPWTRLTTTLIPGLGSSPLGATYSWLDTGLVNGTRYYYRLEDVDTASKSTFHGPVSAVPVPAWSPPGEGGGEAGGGDDARGGGGEPVSGTCPRWILAAAPDAVSPTCTPHGDAESVSLSVLSRTASGATLELRTGGFWTLEEGSGTVRVFVPGLEFPSDPKAPALPLRRAFVDAVVGKGVELVSAEASDLRSFPGLRASAVGRAEMAVGRDGTVRAARRSLPARLRSRGLVPREVARLGGTAFQGERKSAVVEITPVRSFGSGLVLAGRVRVRLAFTGVVEGERGRGSRGRSLPRRKALSRDVLAQLHTSTRGLYAVSFEELFPGRSRGFSTALLRLQRQGEAVGMHVEPPGPVFGPGSTLYFYAERTASSTEYSSELAYELVRASGVRMGVASAPPAGAPVVSSSTGSSSFETNRIYQPGLLEAQDIWLWNAMVSGASRAEGFTLPGIDASSGGTARILVCLQGGSESGTTTDHHVRVSLNGVAVGEARFSGKRPYRLEADLPASLLREGSNALSVANVGDTGVYSLVFLDRFEVSYPQAATARGGVFEGVWAEGGAVGVSGLSGPPVILSDAPGPEGSAVKWLTGFQAGPGSVFFQAEAGYRYTVVSPEGLLSPRVGRVPPSTLKAESNQADYLVIAPREFLGAAAPLVERRRSQGLVSRAVAFEEITSEFGHGQPSAEAIKSFLSYAYHSWQDPSPRYVVLLGDATYDPRHFLPTSRASPLPALWEKTSYLWTASDPLLAAVNGDDFLPDLAIGRLPATTVAQAEALVSKLLAWEDSGQGLGGNAVLVADVPDTAGDFEANVEDIRNSFLADRATATLRVRELGSEARPAILGAFDDGASLVSYVGHGGTAVWSSSNVLNSWDVPSLLAQSRQPVLLTLNCLNGYFVAPSYDSLSESLVKVEGRGVIAAFSPSGLSLDGPAHRFHRALMAEITLGEHERLGDAVLAAQAAYTEEGVMPELLAIYHLLADPGMTIR